MHFSAPDRRELLQKRIGICPGKDQELFRTNGLAGIDSNPIRIRMNCILFDAVLSEFDDDAGHLIGRSDESGQDRESAFPVVQHRDMFTGKAVRRITGVFGRHGNRKRLISGIHLEIRLTIPDRRRSTCHRPSFAIETQTRSWSRQKIPLSTSLDKAESVEPDRFLRKVCELHAQTGSPVLLSAGCHKTESGSFRTPDSIDTGL